MDKVTTIRVKQSTKDKLTVLGDKGDSYDDILCRMLDKVDIEKNWSAFHHLTTESKKIVMMGVFEQDNNYMFDVQDEKNYVGLNHAYNHDEKLRHILNNTMKKLEYI